MEPSGGSHGFGAEGAAGEGMKLLDTLRFFAANMLHRARAEGDMEQELRAHIQIRADDLERKGVARREAERQAHIEFGGYQRVKEECREAMGTHLVETIIQDVGFGWRVLRKSPGFTAVAILTLALGIGANTAVFSVVYAALLRPLPYAAPNQLIALSEVRPQLETPTGDEMPYWNASYPDYLDWTRQSKIFRSFAGFSPQQFLLRGAGGAELVQGGQTTTNFFTTLGVKPILGRDLVAGEDVESGPNVAVISYGFWMRQFGGDRQVAGRSIRLGDRSVQVVGVLPRDFEFAPLGRPEIWVPMHISGGLVTRRSLRWMSVVGRLSRGATMVQARAEMKVITAGLGQAYPQANGAIQVVMQPVRDRVLGKVGGLLMILFGAVGFVLLIACANIANLHMVRASGRRREFAIRAALGARRGRLISQLLAESLMLAAAGAALGFLLARWGAAALIGAIPQTLLDTMPFLADARANLPVLGFLCAVTVLAGVAFGLAPAFGASQRDAGVALREESRASASGSRQRLRHALVVAEIAVSLVLLTGAGLMVESLGALLHRNPGFDTRNLVTFAVNLPVTTYPDDPDAIRFDRQFTERVRALPGVAGIVSNSTIPLTGGGSTVRFLIEGRPKPAGHEDEACIRSISNDYFSMMKIPLLSGRFFDDVDDTVKGPPHVIVNQAWVDAYTRGENPLGKRFRFTFSPKEPYREIVGVVANYADAGLDSPEVPALFLPFPQDANSYITYLVRAPASPAEVIDSLRVALRAVDPQLFLAQPATMEQIIDQSPSVFLRRYPSYLIGGFAALAILLAMVGLYGLISYSVSQRGPELGIRIALGAQRGDILRLVVGEGARLAAIGVAAGLAAGLALTQLMRGLLFGVSAADPATFAVVAIGVGLVALAACCIPARRAIRTDPIVALRYE